MTTEIPQKSWATFCNNLTGQFRGTISLRWITPGGEDRSIAENVPLQTLAFQERTNECSDAMTIEAGHPGGHSLQHQIIEPFQIFLRKESDNGRYHKLEILAETGKTEITFSPSLDPALLKLPA
jgi:hypothetical protein